MLGDSQFVGFITVRDLEAARTFYEDTLGLHFITEMGNALLFDANGVRLRVTQLDDLTPQSFTVAGWQVRDIEEKVDALLAKGVRFLRYDGVEQDERGIWVTPAGGKVAWFYDPDGNLLSLSFH
jgi:catechol 2,3-dioxygenase-like lactoylglutathione lyase family enzyme